MDDYDSPLVAFPIDTLVARMEQLRLIVQDMNEMSEGNEAWQVLYDASQLLLDSCSLIDPDKKTSKGNITNLH